MSAECEDNFNLKHKTEARSLQCQHSDGHIQAPHYQRPDAAHVIESMSVLDKSAIYTINKVGLAGLCSVT